jgi:hypothetical protein
MLAVVLTEPRIQANEHIRMLGRDSLGETLKEFRVRHPKAICGSAASTKMKPRNLTNAEITDKFYCYLDDRDSLAGISSSPFVNLHVRALSAIFWKSRLYNLGFDLNVRSIRTVLGSFEKSYGQPTLIAMDDPVDTTKLTYLSWVKGDTELQVRLSHSGGEVGQKDSTHLNGQPGVEKVCVELFNTEVVKQAFHHNH